MQGHKLKQSLSQIQSRAKLPVVAQHYSNKRRVAVILRKLDNGNYIGYYIESGEARRTEVEFPPDSIEWILLSSFHGNGVD
jgi:hypothetical protein